MPYQKICQAQDWFYRHEGPEPSDSPVIYQVAVWATRDDGSVVGLIAPGIVQKEAHLHSVPPPGYYIHREQLSSDELALIKTR